MVEQDKLSQEASESDLMHFAPNSATFSRAREIPIKGVKIAPKPIRSSEHPKGIPCEISKMSKRSVKRFNQDTDMSAMRAKRAHKAGKFFSLEHPGNSIALHLPEWKELISEPGVFVVKFHTCMFPNLRTAWIWPASGGRCVIGRGFLT